MNLVIPQCNIEIELKVDKPVILSMENPNVFTAVLSDLWSQSNGHEGELVLSDGNDVLNIEKTIVTIFNPFMVSCNDKKIITKLHKEIQENAVETYYDEIQRLNENIIELLEKATNAIPYGITYNFELDLSALLKMYSVAVEEEDDTFLERIVNYFKVMHRIAGYSCFAVLNLRQYFTPNDLEEFYAFIMREHLLLLILEENFRGKISNNEMIWICDSDLCIIKVE